MRKLGRTLQIIVPIILIILLASCSVKNTNNNAPKVTADRSVISVQNMAEPSPKTEIEVQSPVTLSNSACNFNGKSVNVRLKLIKGRYYEDWNPGPIMGTIWEGSFVIELADEYGNTISTTDISKMYADRADPLKFNSTFNIEFDDYNNDGDLDFTIGQYASSNGNLYRLFTLRKDGRIEELPIKDHYVLFISRSNGYYSTKLNKINGTSFEIEYYDNSVPATFHDFYKWDGKQFALEKSQKMTQEEESAGNINDKNKQYTYVKYGKSEEALIQFTRTGTKIEGHVEIATINKKYQIEINKYPFKGTLVNNYISMTFPGLTWLNSSKGVSWIGNFDYQCFDINIPVDNTVDPNGFYMLSFNKGTKDVFDSFIKELEGRAKEWKREAEKLVVTVGPMGEKEPETVKQGDTVEFVEKYQGEYAELPLIIDTTSPQGISQGKYSILIDCNAGWGIWEGIRPGGYARSFHMQTNNTRDAKFVIKKIMNNNNQNILPEPFVFYVKIKNKSDT